MTPATAAPAPRPGERYSFWLLLGLTVLVTAYRAVALHFAGMDLDLYVDEAQYWTWAQKLDWGYYSKPPVIAAVIALTSQACGDSPFCVKSGALLIYPLSTLLIWALGRRLFGGRVAFWSGAAFLLLPGVSLSSLIISTDVPFFLFWTLALYAYLRGTQDQGHGRGWGWWLLAGAAAGLGLQTKYTMVIFAVSVLLHLGLTPRLRPLLRSPRLYASVLLALLIFAPNLWWNAHHGWPTLRHTEDISHLNGGAGLHWNHLGDFLGSQFGIMGPLFFGAWLVLTCWRPGSWWADERYRFLACFALPFLGLICLQALLGRANANWGAMTYASATVFMTALMFERALVLLFAAGLALNVLLMPITYHFDALTRYFIIDLKARTDPYKRVRGWAELGRQAQLLQAQYPGALFLGDSRDVLSELEYYVHPHPLDAVLWNPRGKVDSQFALSTRMDDKAGRDFVYVTASAKLPPGMLGAFDSVDALPPLHVTIHDDYALDYRVWLLHDFKGYPTDTSTQ